MSIRNESEKTQRQNLETYSDNIRRAASSLGKINSASYNDSMRNLKDSILQSSYEMNTYILERSSRDRDRARDSVKRPRLARLLRFF